MRVNYQEPNAISELSHCLSINVKKPSKALIFCVGTDKSIGDSLGPMVGTILESKNFPCPIIGTLKKPAHALNLKEMKKQARWYSDALIIAIDAATGQEFGTISITTGSLKPGQGVGKDLEEVGDIAIKATTVKYGEDLMSHGIRLGHIYEMAEVIAESITKAIGR